MLTPLVQIGSDYFEDLDKSSFEELISDVENDKSPIPDSRVGRFASEPANVTKKFLQKNSQMRTHLLKDLEVETCLKTKTKFSQIYSRVSRSFP